MCHSKCPEILRVKIKIDVINSCSMFLLPVGNIFHVTASVSYPIFESDALRQGDQHSGKTENTGNFLIRTGTGNIQGIFHL